MKIITYILYISLIVCYVAYGQDHEHHDHEHKTDTLKHEMKTMDTTKPDIQKHDTHDHSSIDTMKNMSHDLEDGMFSSFSQNLPMNRNGSGTGWLPDESPMNAYMWMSGKTQFMFHGSVFLRYTSVNLNNKDKRGRADNFSAPNWFMFMANHPFSKKDLLSFNLMMSLDRFTEDGDGYPLLFQSGETWNGKPLIDRQHPHDLFSELSLGYTHGFNKNTDVTVYFGYPGEPALGPVAFMHRPSSQYNPDAPLSHHWQDATHITFGVGTLGLRIGKVKFEGSVFTGREPDENRTNFDKPKFDSYSGRISFAPDKNFSFQGSYGFIKSPEALEPDVNVKKIIASVIHSKNINSTTSINSSLIYGMNKTDEHSESSLLAESVLQIKRLAVYGRFEFIQKDVHELQLPIVPAMDDMFNINSLTLGTAYNILDKSDLIVTLGVQGKMDFIPSSLETFYGKTPLSAQFYIRLSPGLMKEHSHTHKMKMD